jgi:hypothetical protein
VRGAASFNDADTFILTIPGPDKNSIALSSYKEYNITLTSRGHKSLKL